MKHAGGDNYAAFNFAASSSVNSTMQSANNDSSSSSHGDMTICSSSTGANIKAENTARKKSGSKGESSATNDGNEDWLLPENFRPSKFDVIVGWARQNYHHEGNKMLRNLVRENVPRYMAARTKHDKGLIILEILDLIRRKSPTGVGLVRQNSNSGRWSYIGNDKAKDKIGHALRKASRDYHKTQKRPSKSDDESSTREGGGPNNLDPRRRTSLSSGTMSSLRISSWPSSVVSPTSSSQSVVGGIRGTIDYNANGKQTMQLYASTANSSSTQSLKSVKGAPPSATRRASQSPTSSNNTSSYHPFHSANHGSAVYHPRHPYPPPPPHNGLQYHNRNFEYHHNHPPNTYPHHHLPHHPFHSAHSARPQGAFQAIHPPSVRRTATTPMTAATIKSKATTGTPITSAPVSSCSSSSFVPPPHNHSKAIVATVAAPTNSPMSVLGVPSDNGNDLQVPVREVTVPASPVTRPNSVNSNISSRSSGSQNRGISPDPPPVSSSTPPSQQPLQSHSSKEHPLSSSSHHNYYYHQESSHHGFHYPPHQGGGGHHGQLQRNEAVPYSSFYGSGEQFPQQRHCRHLPSHREGGGENGRHPEHLHYQYSQNHHPSVGMRHPQHHHQHHHHGSSGTGSNKNNSRGHDQQHRHQHQHQHQHQDSHHHPLPLEGASPFPSSCPSQYLPEHSRYINTNSNTNTNAGIQLQQQPSVDEEHQVSHRIFDEVEELHQRAKEAAAAAVSSPPGAQQPPPQQIQSLHGHSYLQQHPHYPYNGKTTHYSNHGHTVPNHPFHAYYTSGSHGNDSDPFPH